MAEDETPLHGRQRVLRRLQEEARIKGGNDTIVRLCIVGFGIAIASLAPVTWGLENRTVPGDHAPSRDHNPSDLAGSAKIQNKSLTKKIGMTGNACTKTSFLRRSDKSRQGEHRRSE